MTGSDAELRSRAEELAYLEQRFDIHVMAFADESDATAQALQAAFAVDRATAQRMIASTPVVVKRAATPEVAGALLDALGKLGAQVVLLPSDTKASLPPAAAHASGAVSVPPAAAAASSAPPPPARHAAAAPPTAAAWGALDLQLSAPAPRAMPLERKSLPARDAALLEESLDESESDAPPPALEGAASSEPHLHSSAPPALPRRTRTPRPESAQVEFEPEPAGRAAPPAPPPAPSLPTARTSLRASELGLGTVPPLPPRMSRPEFVALIPSGEPPLPLSLTPDPPPPRAPRAPAAAPRARGAAGQAAPAGSPPSGQRPVGGRGSPTVPRLKTAPAAGAGPAGKRAPKRADPTPPPAARQVFEHDPFPAPSLSALRAEFPTAPQPAAARAAEPSRALPLSTAERPKTPVPVEPAARPSRGLSLLMLVGSVLGLGLGVFVGDSVLQGDASVLSIALHGVALYAFGVGLAGLRP